MRKFIVLLRMGTLIATLLSTSSAIAAPHPSFDCHFSKNHAPSALENMICGDDTLARLDWELSGVYHRLLSEHPNERMSIRENQRIWHRKLEEELAQSLYPLKIKDVSERYANRLKMLNSKTFVADAVNASPGNDHVFKYTLSDNITLIFHGDVKASDDTLIVMITTMHVIRGGKEIQILPIEILMEILDNKKPDFENIDLFDVNFDGYPDIRIEYPASATGNVGYDYFIYDPVSQLFKISREADKIALSYGGTKWNQKTGIVSVDIKQWACRHDILSYKWYKNGLNLIEKQSSGVINFSEIPVAGILCDDYLFSGQMTLDIDDNGVLHSVTFAPDDSCTKDAETLPSVFQDLSSAPKSPKYRLEITDNSHFRLVYTPPLIDKQITK